MHAQGQAPDGESYTSHNPSNANNKMSSSSSSRSYCQRAKRCSALEPVLEHCELAAARLPSCVEPIVQQQICPTVVPKGTKPLRLRILSRLCDGYVKLMNEMASGADLKGASSFYGAGYGTVHLGENAAFARSGSGSKETKSATSLRQTAGASSRYNDFGVWA